MSWSGKTGWPKKYLRGKKGGSSPAWLSRDRKTKKRAATTLRQQLNKAVNLRVRRLQQEGIRIPESDLYGLVEDGLLDGLLNEGSGCLSDKARFDFKKSLPDADGASAAGHAPRVHARIGPRVPTVRAVIPSEAALRCATRS